MSVRACVGFFFFFFLPNASLPRPGVVGNLTSSELAHHWQRSVKFRLVWFYGSVGV